MKEEIRVCAELKKEPDEMINKAIEEIMDEQMNEYLHGIVILTPSTRGKDPEKYQVRDSSVAKLPQNDRNNFHS